MSEQTTSSERKWLSAVFTDGLCFNFPANETSMKALSKLMDEGVVTEIWECQERIKTTKRRVEP